MKLHNPFARHTGRHVPRTIPGTMLQPVSFNDEPEDDWGEPDEDDGRCVHCGADTGHYNGCTEDPGAMCLCHLCMGDQAVTSEAECPYHGASGAPERPSWWERVSGGASALIDGCARGPTRAGAPPAARDAGLGSRQGRRHLPGADRDAHRALVHVHHRQ